MFTRLVFDSLRRSRRRKLLALFALATSAGALSLLLALLLAADARVALELQGLGANIVARPAPGQDTLPVAELAKLRRIFWRNNVVAVAPLYELRPRLVAARDHTQVAALLGTWFDHPLDEGEPAFRTGLPKTRPALALTGRWPRDGPPGAGEAASPHELVLGRRLAERLAVALGDALALELGPSRIFATVVGVADAGGPEDEQAFASLATAAALGARAHHARAAEVFALTTPEPRGVRGRDPRAMSAAEYDRWYCTAYPSSIAHQIGEALDGADAVVVSSVTAASATVVERLRVVLAALGALIAAGALAATTAAMSATVAERRLELGLFLALGAGRATVLRFFLSEAAALGALAGSLGGAAAIAASPALARLFLDHRVGFEPLLGVMAIGCAVAIAVLGAAVPVLRALRRASADLLREAPA